MSLSPERISSYRRHFEDTSSSSYQVRVSSPSPTRREARHVSAGYACKGSRDMRVESVGRRNISAARRTRTVGAGVSAGAMVCVGPSGEPAMDLDAAAAENQEFLSTRTSERQEMIVLNDRLAVYIDKVRSLEQQNKLLETEIEAYQNRFEKPTGLRLLYEEQLRELKKIADQMRVQRDISLAAKESTAAQLEAIKIKYEEAVELRRKAELDIETFRPDVDKATSSRIALEKKLEQLEVELEFLKRVHQQEIDELMKQIYAAHASAESAFALPDLAAAMKQIQNQYDDIAAKNLQEMDSWYKTKFDDLTSKTSRHVDRVRGFREEIAGAKKDIQSKERDLDSLRTKNEALEAQIRELQEKYRKEQEELQARIETLQLELKSTKEKIALHLREYQELLNVKMSLEIEITTYRKLIEGEDLRLSGMVQTLSLTSCSMSAISAGVSLSAGGVGGVGGMSGGMIGGSSAGTVGSGVGIGGGMGAGGMGRVSGSGAGGMAGRVGAGGPGDKMGPAGRVGGAHVGAGRGLGSGSLGVGAARVGIRGSSGGIDAGGRGGLSSAVGLDAGGRGGGAGGLGAGVGGLGTRGLGTDAGGVGVGGLGAGSGVGARGLGTDAGGVGVGGLGAGSGVGARGLGTDAGGVGVGGLGAGSGVVARGLGTDAGGVGVGGLGAGSGVGARGLGTDAGGVGVAGLGTGSGVGARGLGTDARGVGVGGLGAGSGVGARGLGTDAGGVGVGGLGAGSGVGAGGLGAGTGGIGAGGVGSAAGVGGKGSAVGGVGGLGTGAGGLGAGTGGIGAGGVGSTAGGGVTGDSYVSGVRAGTGGDTAGSVGMDATGTGVGRGKGDAISGGMDRDGGRDPAVIGRTGVNEGAGDVGAALSSVSGMGKTPGGMGDSTGSGMGSGTDGFDGNHEAYTGQAVELTERRTVLIRTVKNEDDVLEMDHQEQTYTITGAADDSDEE